MKRLLSILSFVFVISILSSNAQCCQKATEESKSVTTTVQNQSNTNVKAYYFHGTRRCATCQAVESVTKEALKKYYGDKVAFLSLNIEEEKNSPMIEKFKISGQTLLIVKGNKTVNLTNDAFMNARTKPEKLKAKIKSTVDSMI